jgi:hypothetical protein
MFDLNCLCVFCGAAAYAAGERVTQEEVDAARRRFDQGRHDESDAAAEKRLMFKLECLCRMNGDPDGDEEPGRDPISCRHYQGVLRWKIPGELAKHSVSEGTKAITKFTSSSATSYGRSAEDPWDAGGDDDSWSAPAGLQFPPYVSNC